MTTLRKAKALRAGSTLGIVSPASTPKAELVHAGIAELERAGYRTKLFPHALDRGPLYYAGRLEDRLSDLHAAFADNEVDGIVCTRGGWGSAELLPHLDASLIASNPKAFLGYSDQTSLHIWLLREVGLVSFQAPMVAADFSRSDGAHLASWLSALTEGNAWMLSESAGLRALRPGLAEGALTGGCLSIYVESLGTPFAPVSPHGILFLEDISVKAYQWDRMLLHLRFAGMLQEVSGIVFGDMSQCGNEEEQRAIEASLLHVLRDFSGPIAIGLRSGHVPAGNVTLPFGIQVSLDCRDTGNPAMHFLESAVEG